MRTPRLLLADEDAVHLPAYSAVVEDVSGGSLQEALRTDPARGRAALERLAGLLERMRARDSAGHGKAGLVHEGGMPHGTSCAQVVADRAVRDIEEAAARDDRVRVVRTRLAERIRELQRAVRPRGTCTLVHGELGPDHVLLTADGEPALIDIEGLMYFDVEWEHVFLELRFGPHYDVLRVPGLDEDRLRLYRLAMHLNLVAGPLRLLDGDFPDREPMRAIAEANLQRVLSLLRSDA
ncbi:hypothetical protein GCM10010129_21520 [Streptomyces fumigatiscleroticus]|nr:hypothetical protein GCM10010129_21520 [Streptomyces fumigatiscleroticus]